VNGVAFFGQARGGASHAEVRIVRVRRDDQVRGH